MSAFLFSAKELLAALKNECRPMLHESSKIIHLEPFDSPLRFAHSISAEGCSDYNWPVADFQITVCNDKKRRIRSWRLHRNGWKYSLIRCCTNERDGTEATSYTCLLENRAHFCCPKGCMNLALGQEIVRSGNHTTFISNLRMWPS